MWPQGGTDSVKVAFNGKMVKRKYVYPGTLLKYWCSRVWYAIFMLLWKYCFCFGHVWKDINQISFLVNRRSFYYTKKWRRWFLFVYTICHTCTRKDIFLPGSGGYYFRICCHQAHLHTLREHITKTSQTKEKNTKNHVCVCSLFPWNEWNIDYYCFPLIQVVLFIKHFNVMWGNTSSIKQNKMELKSKLSVLPSQ